MASYYGSNEKLRARQHHLPFLHNAKMVPVRLLLYVCDLCHQWSVRTPATNWQRNQWWCHQKQPHIKAAAPTGLPHGIMGGLGGDGQDSIIPSGPQGPVSKRRVLWQKLKGSKKID